MHLTRHTDNALRCLTLLALAPETPLTAREIARRMRMSEAHLLKVIGRLSEFGYVVTQRGRHGGVRLARAAARITVGDVVRHLEGDFSLVECFTPETNQCPIAPACVLAGTLDRALRAFLAVLDETTVAELVKPRRRLAALAAA